MEHLASLLDLALQYLVLLVVVATLAQLLVCTTIEVIAEKQGVAAPWLAWVPLLQIYPVLKAGDGSLAGFVVLLLSLVAVCLAGALLAPVLSPLVAAGLVLAWSVGASLYFGRLLRQTALNRGVSGRLGLLVFVPLVGPFAYLYIAFHDGIAGPSRLGLALGLVIYVLPSVPVLASFPQAEELRQQLTRASAGASPSALLPGHGAQQDGFPVTLSFDCPEGTVERGAAPPEGRERWCERALEAGRALKHGPYVSWHENGQVQEFGSYRGGEDRKSTRLNSSHSQQSRMPSSA